MHSSPRARSCAGLRNRLIQLEKLNYPLDKQLTYPEAHFATFPEELPRRCIRAASKPGDLILEPFGGSGTTGLVTIELGCRAMSVDLAYETGAYKELAEGCTSEVQIDLRAAANA